MSGNYTGAETPVRQPDTTSSRTMTKRAWWLVLLNFVLPGSAQVLAGNRRLGRFGLRATLFVVLLVVAAVAVWLIAPVVAYGLATNTWVLLGVQVLLVGYAVLWIVLTIDTLRLANLIKASPVGRSIVAVFSVLLLVMTTGAAGWAAVNIGAARSLFDQVFSGGNYAEPIDGRYNILLLGGDAGPDRMGLRPDSISVVSIDAETGASTIIGIPRNMQRAPFSEGSPLWDAFPTGYDCGNDCLISYLYTYGEEHTELYPDAVAQGSEPGIEAMRDTAEGVLGIQLQYYVLIDMEGFSDLIDSLGGVEITVAERLPIEGGEDSSGQPINVSGWIEEGRQQMDGYTALWYARSRHGTSDYDRMGRQREVQAAILKQFEPAKVLTKFKDVAEAGAQVVKTDIPQTMLGRFVELAGKARKHELEELELVPPQIDMVHPDFADIQERVADAIAPVKPSNSP